MILVFKSQHVTGGLQTNFINAFKDDDTFKVSVSDPCTSVSIFSIVIFK